MKCWSEGELRAFIDRELPAEDMARLSAHLEQCSECGDHWGELTGRASRVSALMAELTETAPSVSAGPFGRPARSLWRWGGLAAALAAGVVAGILLLPKGENTVAVAPPKRPPETAVAPSAVAHPEPEVPAVALVSSTPARPVAPARRNRRPAIPVRQISDPFLALDNEPIESGVVLRVALGPREVPADVIIDADGRPRAIRLVNLKSNH